MNGGSVGLALRAARAFLVMALAVACTADSVLRDSACTTVLAPPPSFASGRMIVLPGIANTRFHLAPFMVAAGEQLPRFRIELRRWGVRFLSVRNLLAHARNLEAAEEIAQELAQWRRAHPHELLYLVGFSGGGALAVLIAAALPEGVLVDRLVLVAPAISPDYPLEEEVLPKVRDFVVSFASERDLQVSWGTRTFGTIDRQRTDSAGAVGFDASDPRLLEWHWSERALALGHRGGHLSYLGRRWQDARLLPAIDPTLDAAELEAAWARPCGLQ